LKVVKTRAYEAAGKPAIGLEGVPLGCIAKRATRARESANWPIRGWERKRQARSEKTHTGGATAQARIGELRRPARHEDTALAAPLGIASLVQWQGRASRYGEQI